MLSDTTASFCTTSLTERVGAAIKNMDAAPTMMKRIVDIAKARGIDMSKFDPDDGETIAAKFGIASVLALEIVYMNDEAFDGYWCKTPEKRFIKMSEWALKHLKDIPPRRHGWTTRYYVARHLAEISRKRRNGDAET